MIVPNNKISKSYMRDSLDVLEAHFGPGYASKRTPLLGAMMLVLSDDYQVGVPRSDPERLLECKVILAGAAGVSGWKYDLLAPLAPVVPGEPSSWCRMETPLSGTCGVGDEDVWASV